MSSLGSEVKANMKESLKLEFVSMRNIDFWGWPHGAMEFSRFFFLQLQIVWFILGYRWCPVLCLRGLPESRDPVWIYENPT